MSSESARKQVREFNVAAGLSSPPDEAEKKFGNAIPKKKRDFLSVVYYLNKDLAKGYSNIPKNMSVLHYATVAKITQIALRDNEKLSHVTCPKCQENIEVKIPQDKLEKNSCAMLETLLDRMAPKLQTATTQINIQNTIVNLTGGLAQIITEFVPPEKRLDCGIKIRSLIASYQNAIGTEVTPG